MLASMAVRFVGGESLILMDTMFYLALLRFFPPRRETKNKLILASLGDILLEVHLYRARESATPAGPRQAISNLIEACSDNKQCPLSLRLSVKQLVETSASATKNLFAMMEQVR